MLLARPAAGQFFGFVVDSTADGSDASPGDGICANAFGSCTLRAAIEEANTTPGVLLPGFEVIQFAIPGPGPHTIEPLAPLPPVLEPVVIDGYSQPGAQPQSTPGGSDASLLIELSGRSAGPADGLYVAASDSLVLGLVVNGWQKDVDGGYGNGIVVAGTGVGVWGSYLGTDVTGTLAVPNESTGVLVTGSRNAVGWPSVSDRNVISGNRGPGILVEGSGNSIRGNFIGVSAAGTGTLGNGTGVSVRGPYTQVGEFRLVPPNVISGNAGPGIEILATAAGSEVLGNLIGTDPTETLSFGNGGDGISVLGAAGTVVGRLDTPSNVIVGNAGHGVRVIDATDVTIAANQIRLNAGSGLLVESSGTTIGGLETPWDPNEIAFNGADGITIVGSTSRGSAVRGNSIYGNGDLGIDLGDDGPTPNDPLDTDNGPNGLQNFPVISSAQHTEDSTLITGYLEGAPGTYRLTFFVSGSCDDPDHVAADPLLTLGDVTIESSGTVLFDVSAAVLPPGTGVTATAEDADGNTSELAACVAVVPAPSTTTSVTTTTTPTTIVITTSTTVTTTTLPDPCPTWRSRLAHAAGMLVTDQCPARARVVHRLLRRVIWTLHPRNVEAICPPRRMIRAARLIDRVERVLGEPCGSAAASQ